MEHPVVKPDKDKAKELATNLGGIATAVALVPLAAIAALIEVVKYPFDRISDYRYERKEKKLARRQAAKQG